MAENTLEFTTTYPSLDEAAAEKQRDIERRAAILDEQERMQAPEVPGRTGEQTQPNPLVEAVGAAFKAVGTGAQNTMQGLTELLLPQPTETVAKQTPAEFLDSKVQAARKTIVEGLVQVGAAPFIGMGAGAAQELENNWPELAKTEALDASAGFTLRHIMAGAPALNTLQPEEIQAMRQPMTVKELLDLTVQSAPMALGGIRKVSQAAKIQAPTLLGEKGGINLQRVQAAEAVKQVMNELDAGASAELIAHRERVGHAATIEGAKQYTKNVEEWLRLEPDNILLDKDEGTALRDTYNRAATNLEATYKKALAGDEQAAQNLLPLLYVAGKLGALDEANGRNVARALEARTILSEAARGAGMQPKALRELLDRLQAAQPTPVAKATAVTKQIIEAVKEGDVPESKIKEIIPGEPPEVVAELTKETSRLIQRAEQQRAKAEDDIAAIVASANIGGEPKAPHAPSIAQLIRGKIGSEMFAEEMKKRSIPISREALRAVMDVVKKVNADIEDQLARDRDTVVTTVANALMASGRRAERDMTLAEAVAEKIRFDLHALGGGTVSPETLMALLGELDKRQRGSWARQIYNGLRAGKDMLYTGWIHSLLTSFVTHTTNILGTAVGVLADIPERFTAEWLNAIRHNAPDGPQLGESARSIYSLLRAHEDMIRLLGMSWRMNEAPFEASAAKRAGGPKVLVVGGKEFGRRAVTRERSGEIEINARHYGFDPDTGFGKIIETLGAGLNSRYTPGAALMLEDAAMKGIPYRMELNAQAHRIASLEGLEGAAFEARRSFLENNPTTEMIVAAEDKAILITLNAQLGTFGQWFTLGANMIPGGRVALPFIRWSGNAIKWVNQRTPVLNMLSHSNWQDIMAGGAAQNRAIARMAVGNAVGAVIAYNVMQGNITGGANTKQQQSLKIYQDCGPYSFRLGDGTCIENYLRTLGQVGQMIGAVADYVTLVNEIPDQGTMELWAAHGEGVALALGHMFANQSSMQQLANTLEIIKDPQRNSLKEAFGLARSLVPTGVRQITRAVDDNLVREVRTIGDAIKSGLPLYVNDVEIHRNPITGEPIKYPEGVGPDIASPVFFSKRSNDPVFKKIVETKVNMPPLPWYVMGTDPGEEGARMVEPSASEGVRLKADERDFWITKMTTLSGPGGLNLHEYLTEMVASERFNNQSKDGQAYMLRTAYNNYKTAGFAELLNPDTGSPTLKDRIERQLTERLSRMAPITDPRSPQYTGGR
jgi:hypothetical protein